MEEGAPKPGWLMPILWVVVGAVTVCGGASAIGMVAVSGSESDGVAAATFATGPIGFGLAGALAGLVTHFVAKSAGVRVAVPIGCGCLGWIGASLATVFFFAAIFPAL